MGVPSFYRWLVAKYPKIVVDSIEKTTDDATSPNPNGLEFDNLYLDMNGIIHPCFHSDDHPSSPSTFEEVFNNVYEYIDRLFHIVRPRKLLYMAIDGVAPRAKMNQQRTRRFRTAKDLEIAEAEENRLRSEFELERKPVFPRQVSEVSDSNVITPGTEFMHRLSKSLKAYVHLRLRTDAAWKDVNVIISDASVPGEGEHKIMSFIRAQRTYPNYDPNTRHCLYGLDADLIMLALASHEVHFSILREDVLVQGQETVGDSALQTTLCRAEAAKPNMSKSRGWLSNVKSVGGSFSISKKPFQFLHIWILREYLELDLKSLDTPKDIKIDLERLVDDFIFICFFTGNDFLPHMPTLEIHEGAIDLLMHIYKEEFKNLGGYLVDMNWVGDKNARYVKLSRVEKFILLVGTKEEQIFRKRSEIRDRKLRRLLSESSDAQEEEQDQDPDCRNNQSAFANGRAAQKLIENFPSSSGTSNSSSDILEEMILKNTKEMNEKLKSCIRDRSDLFKNGSFMVDKVKLGAPRFKERYYKEKFLAETKVDIERTKKELVQKYTEGLCWVLSYYFSVVPSWTWFYPFHYGPFASDLKGLGQAKVKFQEGSPLKPLDQLMAVLPPRSAHALPRAYQKLMTKEDSKIIDFYPTDFEADTDGKRFMWQAICKLPFINEERLLCETKKLEGEVEDHEAARNSTKVDFLYVRSSNNLQSQIFSPNGKNVGRQTDMVKELIHGTKLGIFGYISPCNMDFNSINFAGPSTVKDPKDGGVANVLCVHYELPKGCRHIPRPLEGVVFPDKIISEADIAETQQWHEHWDSRPNSRLPIQRFSEKTNNEGKSSSPNSSRREKGAGTGFIAGRGRAHRNAYVSGGYNMESYGRPPFGRGNGPAFSGRHSSGGSSSSWQDVRPFWSAGSGRVESKGIQDLRISDSRRGYESNERARNTNDSFRTSGNVSMSRRSYDRRQSSDNFRQPGNISMPGRSYEWREGDNLRQPGNFSMSRSSNQWRQSVEPNDLPWNSVTGRGRGQWRRRVEPNGLPGNSVTGRGRGQGMPNASFH